MTFYKGYRVRTHGERAAARNRIQMLIAAGKIEPWQPRPLELRDIEGEACCIKCRQRYQPKDVTATHYIQGRIPCDWRAQ